MLSVLIILVFFAAEISSLKSARDADEYDLYEYDNDDYYLNSLENNYGLDMNYILHMANRKPKFGLADDRHDVGDIPNSDVKIDYVLLSGSVDRKTQEVINDLIVDVERIFDAYLREDPGVRAGVLYFDSCVFKKRIYSIEHYPRFKKLKILLGKHDIVDLSFKALVPMKRILQIVYNSSVPYDVPPDFTNLMFAIQDRMADIEPRMIMNYNIYFSGISQRIRESSLAGAIERLLKEIFIYPVCKLVLQDFVKMNFYFHSMSPLMFAMLTSHDPMYWRGRKRANLRKRLQGASMESFLDQVEEDFESQNRGGYNSQLTQAQFRSELDGHKRDVLTVDAISNNTIEQDNNATSKRL